MPQSDEAGYGVSSVGVSSEGGKYVRWHFNSVCSLWFAQPQFLVYTTRYLRPVYIHLISWPILSAWQGYLN